jgi:transposase-like protein
LLHRTRFPLKMWFDVAWHVCEQKNGMSALGLQRAMGFGSYHTAWEWLHRIRRVMVLPARSRLTGEVEVDETYLGAVRHGKRGRGAAGQALVLIAAEVRGAARGRVRLKTVRDSSAASLLAAVEELVEPGSNVVTDGLSSYAGLPGCGYEHTVSRHSAELGRNLLPKAQRVAVLLKRWILETHQGSVGREHLQQYLDEFVFRFNRRSSPSRGLLFYRLLEQAVAHRPVSRREIMASK